jgi:hypothetical protein
MPFRAWPGVTLNVPSLKPPGLRYAELSPIPASSGKINRYRLNRGGDRRANAALYRIVVAMLRYDVRTKTYLLRRMDGRKQTKTEVIRSLKRCVVREVFGILHDIGIQHTLQDTLHLLGASLQSIIF